MSPCVCELGASTGVYLVMAQTRDGVRFASVPPTWQELAIFEPTQALHWAALPVQKGALRLFIERLAVGHESQAVLRVGVSRPHACCHTTVENDAFSAFEVSPTSLFAKKSPLGRGTLLP